MAVTSLVFLAVAALAACAHGAGPSPALWPLLQRPQVQDTHILGGEHAAVGEFPHQASMQVSVLFFLEQHICGATILNEEWILTAAHCIKGVPWYGSVFVLVGKTNLGRRETGQQRSAVKKMYSHEKYEYKVANGVGPYDIGLLQLKTPLVFSDSVNPAKLPQPGSIPTGSAVVSGWGSISMNLEGIYPDKLQKVALPIIPFNECNDWVQANAEEEKIENRLAESNVCVGSLTVKGQGTCSGDSGGPLIQTDASGDVVVIGATSWGYTPCQYVASPSVFTRVSAFNDWINETMQRGQRSVQ